MDPRASLPHHARLRRGVRDTAGTDGVPACAGRTVRVWRPRPAHPVRDIEGAARSAQRVNDAASPASCGKVAGRSAPARGMEGYHPADDLAAHCPRAVPDYVSLVYQVDRIIRSRYEAFERLDHRRVCDPARSIIVGVRVPENPHALVPGCIGWVAGVVERWNATRYVLAAFPPPVVGYVYWLKAGPI